MKRRNWIIALATIVVVAIGAWMFGLIGGTDPAVAKMQEMANQAFDQNLTEAQQQQSRDQFRQQMDTLTPDQRRAFFDANRDRWMRGAEQRMDEFFKLSPAEQTKKLDDMINRMQQPRQNEPRNNDGKQAGGDRGGRGNWGNMTEAQRDERSKRRLDQTSPKMRAQFAEFRKRLDDRAKQRGISQLPGWWGGRRGA